jgi:hypothetical protein
MNPDEGKFKFNYTMKTSRVYLQKQEDVSDDDGIDSEFEGGVELAMDTAAVARNAKRRKVEDSATTVEDSSESESSEESDTGGV